MIHPSEVIIGYDAGEFSFVNDELVERDKERFYTKYSRFLLCPDDFVILEDDGWYIDKPEFKSPYYTNLIAKLIQPGIVAVSFSNLPRGLFVKRNRFSKLFNLSKYHDETYETLADLCKDLKLEPKKTPLCHLTDNQIQLLNPPIITKQIAYLYLAIIVLVMIILW